MKGSLGYLNERGSLYDHPDDTAGPSSLWDHDNFEVTTEKSVNKSEFIKSLDTAGTTIQTYNFDREVRSWVDYCVPRFHPRTVNAVKQYQSSSQSFDVFHYGRNLWQTDQFVDEFTDKIRQYAEECELMQGFQVRIKISNDFW